MENKDISINKSSLSFGKWDLWGSLIIGEVVAWLLFIMAKVNADALPIPAGLTQGLTSIMGGIVLAVILPVLSAAGLYVAYMLAKKIRMIFEAAKFALVGALNTFVDLGILNLLILLTGIASGSMFNVFKGISFIVAAINSYAWNKYWTFDSKKENIGKEFAQFMFVSVVGFFLNVVTAALVVNTIGPQFGIAPEPWASVGALAGTFVVFVWNFVGYKFWVFKK